MKEFYKHYWYPGKTRFERWRKSDDGYVMYEEHEYTPKEATRLAHELLDGAIRAEELADELCFSIEHSTNDLPYFEITEDGGDQAPKGTICWAVSDGKEPVFPVVSAANGMPAIKVYGNGNLFLQTLDGLKPVNEKATKFLAGIATEAIEQ